VAAAPARRRGLPHAEGRRGAGRRPGQAPARVRAGRHGPGRGGAVRRLLRRGHRDQRGPAPAQGAGQHLRPGDAGRARVLAGRQALIPAGRRRTGRSPPAPGRLVGRVGRPRPPSGAVAVGSHALPGGTPMAKEKVLAVVKIQIPAGQGTPAPPVGTALGPHGVAIMDFCKAYNAQTESQRGTIVPVEITIYEDRSFSFVLKTPPTPVLLREAAGIDKASTAPGREQVGTVTEAQIEEIAKIKMPDLNAYDLESAKAQIIGTARSMDITVAS